MLKGFRTGFGLVFGGLTGMLAFNIVSKFITGQHPENKEETTGAAEENK